MGKSASGKDTLQNELIQKGFERVVTATTRPMREGEQDGKDYHFLSEEAFNQLKSENGFVESTLFNGVQYGCPKAALNFDKQQCIILEPEGVQNFQKEFGRKNMFVVYMDLDEEIRKLRSDIRGSVDEEAWQKRVESDNKRFDKALVDELTDFHLDCTGAMKQGENPKHTAVRLLDALAAYEHGIERNPDEKLTVSFDAVNGCYYAFTAKEKAEYDEEVEDRNRVNNFDDVPF
jgi:guanylate kinase